MNSYHYNVAQELKGVQISIKCLGKEIHFYCSLFNYKKQTSCSCKPHFLGTAWFVYFSTSIATQNASNFQLPLTLRKYLHRDEEKTNTPSENFVFHLCLLSFIKNKNAFMILQTGSPLHPFVRVHAVLPLL